MSARSPVLDGTGRAASVAAADARLSELLGWGVRGDILLAGRREAGAGRVTPS